MIQLPENLMEDMRLAAIEAGQNALLVKKEGRKAGGLKEDQSIITIGDTEGEEIIRKRLGKYGFSILGEEQGYKEGHKDFVIIIDPIDGTTNYDIGDPAWMASIGLLYKDKPVAGVTYQPELDKLYWAEEGKGAFLKTGDHVTELKIPPPPTRSYVIDLLFARHPNFEQQGIFYGRSYEEIPDALEAITGKKITPKYRTTGCPSVPLCAIADGGRSALIAKPIKLWDVAASIVIAQEAGAQIHFVPEDPQKAGLEDWHMMVAAVPELFPTLKHIFDATVGRHANVYNTLEDYDIAEQFAQNGIKYGISVGRRQPMHVVHMDCIQEIVDAGLHPVIVIGSANAADSEYYDPVKNPLSIDQQREQIKTAMQNAGIEDYTILDLRDRGSTQYWVSSLNWMLHENDIKAEEAVMHFRTKDIDKEQLEGAILPLSAHQQAIIDYGISVWESVNKNREYDTISSTPFRYMDLNDTENLALMQRILSTPELIITYANQARENNPDKELLENVPVTMADLTLERLRQDKDISTADVVQSHEAESLNQLSQAITTIMTKPGAQISGDLKAQSSKQRNAGIQ